MIIRRPLLTAALLSLGFGLLQPGLAVARSVAGWSESGLATWYGGQHAGRRTSSGEVFDPALMTAAHSTLPLGSYVRVTVQSSGNSIVVRVNDREPVHGQRCIDLSKGAAARLGIVSRGKAMVSIDQLEPTQARTEMAAAATGAASETEVADAPDDAVNAADAQEISAPRGRRHRHHARQ